MMLDFARPEMLYLLPCVLVFVFLASYFGRKKENSYKQSWGDNADSLTAHSFQMYAYVLRMVCVCLGYVSLVLAMSQPRAGFTLQEQQSEGRNILVAVDVSRSMLAEDFPPSRLKRAQREVLDLIAMLEGDRIGLIVFAGNAHIFLPLTRDYDMAELFVSQLSPDIMQNQGTDVGKAMEVALRSLKKDENRPLESRDILIITDGEDHPKEVIEVAERARDMGVRIFAMGVGSPQGALLKMPDGSYLRDAKGNIVLSKLDESTLESIARITGGSYVLSVVGNEDMKRLYEGGIRARSTVVMDSEEGKVWNEWFPWLLLSAFISWLLAFVISPYRFKPVSALSANISAKYVVWAFMCIVAVCSGASKVHANLVHKHMHPDFLQAIELMQSMTQEGGVEGGVESAQQLVQAKELLEGIVTDPKLLAEVKRNGKYARSRDLLHASYYNLAHILIQMRQFNEAFASLKKAYALRNDHKPTLDNLKWLSQLLEEIKNQEQQQNQQSQQNQQGQQSSQAGVQDSAGSRDGSGEDSGAHSKEQSQPQDQDKEQRDPVQREESSGGENSQGSGKEDTKDTPVDSRNKGHKDNSKPNFQNTEKNISGKNKENGQQQPSQGVQKKAEEDTQDEENGVASGSAGKDDEDENMPGGVASQGEEQAREEQGEEDEESKESLQSSSKSDTTDPEAMDPEQAANLFRSLENQRRDYGRRFPSTPSESSQNDKDW